MESLHESADRFVEMFTNTQKLFIGITVLQKKHALASFGEVNSYTCLV